MNTQTITTALDVKCNLEVDKSILRFLTTKSWQIPADYLEFYQDYHLRYWCGKYLKTMNINGRVYTYNIIFLGCTPEQAYAASQVRLSFRNPIAELGLNATVLVNIKR